MVYIKPKKSLGQHFLKDKNVAEKIVKSLKADNIKKVLEIGPGKGILTKLLLERPGLQIYAIEIDRLSVEYIISIIPEIRQNIFHEDFLKFDLKYQFKEPIAIIGNFPYNISSQILFKVLESKDIITEVVCMVQKEVAERIVSGSGSKKYGILSVLIQAYYDVKSLFIVNRTVFSPPPKVTSAVIRLTRNSEKDLKCNEELFFKLIKTAFNQRRKILRNSLKSILLNLEVDNNILTKRPEQLSVDEFVYLTNIIEQKLETKNKEYK